MISEKKAKIIHLQRKPRPGNFSLEFIFKDLRNRLKDRFVFQHFESKYYSSGVFNRIKIIWDTLSIKGDVTHVTGDIHFITLGLRKNKTVLTILDCGFLTNSSGLKFHLIKLFWLTLPLLKTRIVTTISEASKLDILKYSNFPPENIRIIPVAISSNFTFKKFKPFDSNCPIFLHIGAAPNKNLLRSIKALSGLSVHLIIIGKLSEEYLKALESENISFANYFDLEEYEIIDLYQKSDVLLFPSTYEGFGMPILEAQAMGKPVITSNLASMPEVAGDAARFVNPFDVQSIKEGVIDIISNQKLREELIIKGFKNIERFEPDTIANLYANVYDEIINDKP